MNNPLFSIIATVIAGIVLLVALIVEALLFIVYLPKVIFWYGRRQYLLTRKQYEHRVAQRMRVIATAIIERPYVGLPVVFIVAFIVIFVVASLAIRVLNPYPIVEGSFHVRACISYVGHIVCLR